MTWCLNMQIEIDWNQTEFPFRDEDYRIIEDYWEDGEEWAVIEILSPELESYILRYHEEWIICREN